MLYTILVILYIITALIIVISLLVNGVRPAKTLAWLLAIFTIPVGGILLYLMIGRNRRKNKLFRLKKPGVGVANPVDFTLPNEYSHYQKIVRLIEKNCGFSPTTGNSLVYLKDGKTTFESIFEALEKAQHFIHLQYYIFEEGSLADSLLEVFRRKEAAGVQIRLIYDGVGSFSLSRPYLTKLQEIGVEVVPFLPFRFGRFLRSVNYRNHRKIIVVDGKVAFTGGINISDKYLKGDPTLGHWHDMHLRIEGPAAADLNRVFLEDWQLVDGRRPVAIDSVFQTTGMGATDVQIVSSGPDDDFPTIEEVYFSIINNARKYLYITNPYIIPGQAILTGLETAALSGVDVRLLISEKNDSSLVNWSVRSYFEELLRASVKIYLFPHGFLHSKLMVCDDFVASVGTANMDVRSFEQNYEVNAIVYDSNFAKALRDDYLLDCSKSIHLTYDTHRQRPWLERLKEGIAKIFSPLL
ncbi:cardiolipin synthase [Flavobacteriaceae bacterium TP-CH-4]|uniref:Cardiolipin synthase n=1 Tax=Pelagihabitans pacificus TaxID=2696054 RepID=A0A967E3V0_9FLAO|nr:cardiolipin synthase [Pelagihabitans pacificus]NHF57722.1 cardiolipin synthase [Pelagihabitans pacificus]